MKRLQREIDQLKNAKDVLSARLGHTPESIPAEYLSQHFRKTVVQSMDTERSETERRNLWGKFLDWL